MLVLYDFLWIFVSLAFEVSFLVRCAMSGFLFDANCCTVYGMVMLDGVLSGMWRCGSSDINLTLFIPYVRFP